VILFSFFASLSFSFFVLTLATRLTAAVYSRSAETIGEDGIILRYGTPSFFVFVFSFYCHWWGKADRGSSD